MGDKTVDRLTLGVEVEIILLLGLLDQELVLKKGKLPDRLVLEL